MTPRLAVTTAALFGLAVISAAPSAATDSSPNPTVAPCPNGRPVGPHTACRGPVAHHSGGGGGALTIGLSIRCRVLWDGRLLRPARQNRLGHITSVIYFRR